MGVRQVATNSATEKKHKPGRAIRVLVAEDFPFLRYGLCHFLDDQDDMTVGGEATTAEELLGMMGRQPVDVLLLDGDLPGLAHAEMLAQVRSRFPQVRVVVLISPDHEAALATSITKGADGCLLKTAEPSLLLKAVRSVSRGEPWLQREMTSRVFSQMSQFSDTRQELDRARLTRREREVLGLVGDGLRNVQIAERLFVSERTVKAHISSLLRKLGVKGRVDMARYAIRHQLTSL